MAHRVAKTNLYLLVLDGGCRCAGQTSDILFHNGFTSLLQIIASNMSIIIDILLLLRINIVWPGLQVHVCMSYSYAVVFTYNEPQRTSTIFLHIR